MLCFAGSTGMASDLGPFCTGAACTGIGAARIESKASHHPTSAQKLWAGLVYKDQPRARWQGVLSREEQAHFFTLFPMWFSTWALSRQGATSQNLAVPQPPALGPDVTSPDVWPSGLIGSCLEGAVGQKLNSMHSHATQP